MKKKLISIVIAAALVLSAAVALSGCGNDEYPVEVANIKIDSEPKNIVVLDAPTADIISYMGYDRKLVGRSDEVTQEWLSVAPSVGSADAPDVDKIKATEADTVFAGENLSEDVKESLKKENIRVITMAQAKTPKQVETNYSTLGKILGGKIKGAEKGTESYDELTEAMERVKASVKEEINSGALATVCYIFLEDNSLKLMTSGTYGDKLLSYTGAVNTAGNISEPKIDVNTLKIANPSFVFYADEATIKAIRADAVLSKLSAVRGGKTLLVTAEEMNRQGRTALETLDKMVGFMYPSLKKTKATADEAAKTQPTTAPSGNLQTAATTAPATTAPAAENTSVADKYKIKLDKLSLKLEDENDNVKIMQQRLYDLGYVDDKENITGYYGEISEKAVQSFQKNNGIKETGEADNATLVKLFDSNAVKAS